MGPYEFKRDLVKEALRNFIFIQHFSKRKKNPVRPQGVNSQTRCQLIFGGLWIATSTKKFREKGSYSINCSKGTTPGDRRGRTSIHVRPQTTSMKALIIP